ncbi:MAG: hypothetical protein HOV87_26480 [Catenulispora sp.]|nr:hypothetical protein [Catenulispora sp.]
MLPALRVVAVLHALSFLLQPIMAGFFLSGQDEAIDMHATNAMILVALCLVMTVLAFPVWRRGQVPRPVFTSAAALLVTEAVQVIAGFGHIMWLHVPLGVIMMGGLATLMPLVMRPQPEPVAAGASVTVLPTAEAGE